MKLNSKAKNEIVQFLNTFCNNKDIIPQAMTEAWEAYNNTGLFLLTLKDDEIKPNTATTDMVTLVLGKEDMEFD